jgi:hypothetical protein
VVGELVTRFLLGGMIVSAFALVGELFKPKTFAGLFSAAPSVSIAVLALAFHKEGSAYVATAARTMILGSVAMLAYCALCAVLTRRERVPEWLIAGAAWVAWGAVAFALLGAAMIVGLL